MRVDWFSVKTNKQTNKQPQQKQTNKQTTTTKPKTKQNKNPDDAIVALVSSPPPPPHLILKREGRWGLLSLNTVVPEALKRATDDSNTRCNLILGCFHPMVFTLLPACILWFPLYRVSVLSRSSTLIIGCCNSMSEQFQTLKDQVQVLLAKRWRALFGEYLKKTVDLSFVTTVIIYVLSLIHI